MKAKPLEKIKNTEKEQYSKKITVNYRARCTEWGPETEPVHLYVPLACTSTNNWDTEPVHLFLTEQVTLSLGSSQCRCFSSDRALYARLNNFRGNLYENRLP